MPQLQIPTFDDPEILRTLEVAALLGHDLLVQAFVDERFSNEEAEALVGDIVRDALENTIAEQHYAPDALEFLDILDQKIADRIERDPAFADIAARAAEIVDRDPFTAGSVTDGIRISRSIALTVILMLGLSKLEGRYDWKTGEGYIAMAPGIPHGYSDAVHALGEAVSSKLRSAGAAGRALPKPPSRDGNPGLDDRPPKVETEAHRSSNRRLPHEMNRRDAEQLAYELIDRFKSGVDLADIRKMGPDELFASKVDILPEPDVESDLISVGAGIQPTSGTQFNIALRIQSRRYLKSRVWNRIKEFYRDVFGSIVSVRWVGPVELAASNPHGDWHPWKGAHSKFGIGSPINVAGGCVGAVGLIVKKEGRFFALTMGHVLTDCHKDAVGISVYFAPQPLAAAPANSIGVVELAETFPSISMSDRSPRIVPHGRVDLGLVELRDGSVPNQDGRLKVGSRTFSSTVHNVNIHADRGVSTLKAAARSKETSGTITAFNVRIEAIDRVRGGIVAIEGAVEIELEVEGRIIPGDSGALVCVDRGGTLQPFGLCVGGARRSKIQSSKGDSKSVAYVLPLTDLLRRIGEPEIC